jgi:peptidoglycan/LPS O-acetylase OafA/YrhL
MQRSSKRTYVEPGEEGAYRYGDEPDRRRGPQLVRWGAVFAGGVLALGLLVLFSTLWFALAFGSEVSAIRTNIEWFIGVTAIVCLFIGGMLAGYLAGVRGWGPGMFNGLTIWGLLLLATLTVGVPSVLNVFSLGRIANEVGSPGGALIAPGVDSTLWATFWSILGAFATAGIGGAVGGALARPREFYGPTRDRERVRDRDDAEYYEEEEEVVERRPPRAS